MMKTVLEKNQANGLKKKFINSAFWTFVLKVNFLFMTFIINLILARLLKATGYGVYIYVTSLVYLLCIPAVLGFDTLIVRNVSIYKVKSEWGLLLGLLRKSNQFVVIISVCLAFLAFVIVQALAFSMNPLIVSVFQVAIVSLPLIALTRVRQAAIQGFQNIVLSNTLENLIRPLFLILLIGAAYWLIEKSFTPRKAIVLYVASCGITLFLAELLLRSIIPSEVKSAFPRYNTHIWIRSTLHMLFLSGLHAINAHTDIVMLGVISGAQSSGIYAVATRGSQIIIFILFAVNAVLSPTIAKIYTAGDKKHLQRVITKCARMSFLIALPVGLFLILFGKWFMTLFGDEFISGHNALTMLSIAQLVNVAMGSVLVILIMTGNEREAVIGVGISTIVNIALNAILIPIWQLEGAAIATAVSIVVWNILLVIKVRRTLGIHPTVFAVTN